MSRHVVQIAPIFFLWECQPTVYLRSTTRSSPTAKPIAICYLHTILCQYIVSDRSKMSICVIQIVFNLIPAELSTYRLQTVDCLFIFTAIQIALCYFLGIPSQYTILHSSQMSICIVNNAYKLLPSTLSTTLCIARQTRPAIQIILCYLLTILPTT